MNKQQELGPVSNDQLQQLMPFVGKENKAMVQHVYESRVCTIENLLQTFPKLASNEREMLAVIGKINGTIWPKFKSSIFPSEVSATIKDSAFSLGVIVTTTARKGG